MIKAEWSKIFHSRKVLVAIIAVLFVPVLYAGMFLWAFWDPYANLEDLPVAIVNNDEGATIDGKTKHLGNDLTENLIDSKKFKFTETTQEQGNKGLKNRDYYMEVVIPKDFSKNAGSILEDDPEQMKIIYKPNEGYNFLGGQIGNTALELVRKEVNKQVSATYAKTLFANIKKMGNGFGEAADGAGKLENGAGKLNKGANQLNDGLQTAKDGATQLADGAKSAANGSSDLKNGIDSAANGATQLNDGTKSAAKGSNDLKNGIDSAANGATQLNNGAKSAAKGSNDLNNGITSAKDGSGQLQTGSSDLKKGTETLVSGLEGNTANINALNDGAQQVNTGIGTLSTGLAKLAPGASNVSNGVSQLVTGLGEMPTQVASLKTGVSDLNSGAANLATGTAELEAGTEKLIQQINSLGLTDEQKNQLLATANTLKAGATTAKTGASNLSVGTTALNDKVLKMNAPTTGDLTALKEGAAQVSAGLDQMNEKVSKELAPGTKQLAAGTDKLASNWSSSVEGAKKLDAGAGQLNTGIASLNNGLGQLQTGSGKLTAGLGTLSNGTQSLTDGLGQLQTGSGKLTAGLGTLSNGTQSLVNGMGQLQAGSGKLANGLNTLSNGTQSLVSGAGKLSDGSQQLADGTTKLKDGAGTLQDKLADAHQTASSVHASQKTYDMVGEPVDVDKQEVNKVPNYGTGFAPYFISLGLFVGALLISIVFPLVEPAIKPKNGFSWFASKTVILAVVGFFQSIIVVLISLFVLKIEMANIGAFILLSLITSYVFLALIQMLVTILGDPGRFLAIIVLILQLTTSAGTFPLELVPKALHVFNKILPMTYTVQGFKAAISTGDMGFFGFNIAILLTYLVAFLAITFGFFALLFAKRHSKEATAE